ncbi:DEAD/DEAH box helicase [Yonghaparkia sp. Root332]|uniref:DEAD/DEAH box helicase n=1 Tax=Yonghaparkia sp. Root332 TaxID=1736516 RepID=UPI0006F49F29|nr:DEAD/DEAH box helicase [Yonghaparkia sp. Root332]KQV25781.1 RNA helicase [Yonghaparkia sp. Root332]
MPQNNKGRPSRAHAPARSTAAPAGSRSPKHRGHRPDDADAPVKKARWSRDERVDRGHAPERSRPVDRDERPARSNDRFDRDARPARSADRFDRDARPTRSNDRVDRFDRSTPRSGTVGRGAGARTGRPSRDVHVDRTGTGRTAHRPEWRPRGAESTARPARPARDADRGARSFDRDARPARREFDRDARPARSNDRFARDARPVRSNDRFDRDARPARSFDRDERPARRDSEFYPTRAQHTGPQDDVVLARLTADAVLATDVEGVTFRDLGLGDNIARTLAELGAHSPFPIQAATIPDVLAGRDVLGRGRTGSGKTIAFGAPLVERLMENGGGRRRQPGRNPRALILAPTRELALQIDATVQPIARSVGLFTTQIYGGVPQGRQVGALQRGVDIIIGTPGRIEDLIQQGRLDLSEVVITVLDEADHMCELGFLEPVQRILRETADGGQKLLFSATLDSGVANLVTEFLHDPSVYEVAGEDQQSSTIDHKVLLVEQRDKRAVIEQLASGAGKTLVFARTRAFAEELAEQLDDAGIPATSLHGDLNQRNRQRNLDKLTSGRVNVLVATDVAARGIHVDDISLVIQADAPDEYKTYLHRSGRTGRAGKVGTVVTLITRPRRRRFEELLDRAEIVASTDEVRAGDRLLDELAAL